MRKSLDWEGFLGKTISHHKLMIGLFCFFVFISASIFLLFLFLANYHNRQLMMALGSSSLVLISSFPTAILIIDFIPYHQRIEFLFDVYESPSHFIKGTVEEVGSSKTYRKGIIVKKVAIKRGNIVEICYLLEDFFPIQLTLKETIKAEIRGDFLISWEIKK